jgi:hypothetical protein
MTENDIIILKNGGLMSASYKCPQCAVNLIFDADQQMMSCEHCGATVISDKNTSATFCAFCGSPEIITERLIDTRKPDYIIPFKYGRDKAIEAFFKWCKAGRYTPFSFLKDSNIEKLTGIYVPVWLFDCDTEMDITADASTVSYITTGGRKNNQTTKTETFYMLVRKRKLRFEKIQLDGVTRIDHQLMEDIGAYDLSATEGFDKKYLAGVFAEKSDQSPEDLENKLNMKLKKFHECIFNSSAEKYALVTDVVDKSVLLNPEAHYTFLPVWMLNYKYLGKTYTFSMNGQTGKIAGKPPVSIGKMILFGLVLLSAVGLVGGFIGGWILGGFWRQPSLVLDVLSIAVSLAIIAISLFIVFRLRKRKILDSRTIIVDPVSSEIIEEKDIFLRRNKTVTDTTKVSEILDGENRIRGCGEFLTKSRHLSGGCSADDENRDKVDSDGNRN